jgi:hypothetical protein
METRLLALEAQHLAKQAGWRTVKSRLKKRIRKDDHGGWRLVDGNNRVVAGPFFDLTVGNVIDLCERRILSAQVRELEFL